MERSERYCSLCLKDNIHVVGDECHALIKCPHFNNKRKVLFNNLITECPKFIFLDDQSKLEFMLTYEGCFIVNVCKFAQYVLSVERGVNFGSKNMKKSK